MRRATSSCLLFAPLIVAGGVMLGCGGDETDAARLVVPEGCNPLAADTHCLLPYPSDYFLDATTSPPRVRMSEAGWPTANGVPFDLLELHRPSGFSVGTPILALFGEAIDPAPLVFLTDDIARSTQPDSPTLVLDLESGELVPHFAELDPRAFDDASRALVIHPLVPLAYERRYLVAIHGLLRPDGSPLKTPSGFADLRDRGGAAHPELTALSGRYESEIFPAIEAVGVERGDVQLAWDFTTRPEDDVTRDMLTIRDDVLTRLAAEAPQIEIVNVTDDPGPHIARQLDVTVRVPKYVDAEGPPSSLNRNPDGDVVADGFVDVPFKVLVPPSVANRSAADPPARLLQFGHGFFGSSDEALDFASELADERGFVIVAADWWGMTSEDRVFVIQDITEDFAQVGRFTDRVHQAMANFLYVGRAAQGALAGATELEYAGGPAYDPTDIYFYGISQGHILGSVYLALSPDIERGVLSVGGANFSLMMFRSRAFAGLLAIIGLVNSEPLDQQIIVALLQSTLDRIDPLSYAPYVLDEPLPGAPTDRRVLLHMGLGDAAVPNLGSAFHARALGTPQLVPSPQSVPLLDEVEAPVDGSAFVMFDFGIDPVPGIEGNPSLTDTEAHEGVRQLDASKAQVDAFLRPGGLIVQTCDGPCDPE